MNEKYLSHTWVDSRLRTGQSRIDGTGIFAAKDIRSGELLMIWGGVVISQQEYTERMDQYRYSTLVQIDDDRYLGLRADDLSDSMDEYLNHSCDPNSWLMDEVTVAARRDIRAGEEVTMDSALWNADDGEEYSENGECKCGSALCRKIITPYDWKRPELQQRYAGHFSPFIARRIKEMQANSTERTSTRRTVPV